MDEIRTPAPAEDSPAPAAFGYCSWHEGHARGVRLVGIHEQGSGPGGGVFACGPCRAAYDLVAIGDRP